MKSQAEEPIRRNYSSPDLIVYGNIREITQARDNSGKGDGGMNGATKT